MPHGTRLTKFSFPLYFSKTLSWFILGGFLAACGVQMVLVPNELIDGGIVGLSLIASHFFGHKYLPFCLVLFNLPFVILAFKQIGKYFVIQMMTAVVIFSCALWLIDSLPLWFGFSPIVFKGSEMETVVFGGAIIGVGCGLIIRHGGSTDGTEIMGIIINKKRGYTVGQVILFVNFFIFALAGIVYQNWHTAFVSFLTYGIATKVMDMVILGLEDTKSVTIITSSPRKLGQILMENLGVGLTYIQAEGGYSGEPRNILYIVVERLQLSQLKEIVHREDPYAFIAIENLHEVINGKRTN
ncbi:lipoprotein [Chlamydia abortus]|uniref:YitT family protein n=1 Tax=Chlamydia abortus TaxID=83555 RepID=UPI000A27C688|nr:YitT family protein [Chlamydia abortus]SGA06188.1 lipoprotein [Chlamydia abortus]SHD83812.1 lipoprotein [Chlamydia abortus]